MAMECMAMGGIAMGTYDDTLAALESCGTAQNRKTYRRHGVLGEQFGVSAANLKKLLKGRKGDEDLARRLWASGNHDARVLATMIADGKRLQIEQAERWADDLDSYVLADAFGKWVARSPHAQTLHEAWKDDQREFVAQTAWNVLVSLADKGDHLDDAYFAARLEQIERQVHQRPNRVRHAMNMALIAIGGRNENLRKLAIAAADRIGSLDVDHGETGCKTPMPEPYIERMWQHKRKMAAKRAARR